MTGSRRIDVARARGWARLAVDVPEAHYPRIRTLAGCVAYLAERK